jgi:hypothetical protein
MRHFTPQPARDDANVHEAIKRIPYHQERLATLSSDDQRRLGLKNVEVAGLTG